MTLQSVDDVHGGDGLSLGVLGIGDGISDDVLKEDLEDTAGLLVDETGDTLDTTTTRETANGGLGDTLDVITQHFAMTLGASLSEALSSLAASRHDLLLRVSVRRIHEEVNSGMRDPFFSPLFVCLEGKQTGRVNFFEKLLSKFFKRILSL